MELQVLPQTWISVPNSQTSRPLEGLRGRMEAGWSRMNDLIVVQTSQVRLIVVLHVLIRFGVKLNDKKGLCSYATSHIPDARSRGVVIGHDHRHHSRDWAELVAMVFLNKGVKVYLHRGLVHTPLFVASVKSYVLLIVLTNGPVSLSVFEASTPHAE